MKFKRMTDPNLFGYEATVGNRRAEVVRSYPGKWNAFYFQDGKQISLGYSKPSTTKAQATKDAVTFLKQGIANPTGETSAKKVFAHLMEVSRTRPLTPREKRMLTGARQSLRKHRKPVTGNPKEPTRLVVGNFNNTWWVVDPQRGIHGTVVAGPFKTESAAVRTMKKILVTWKPKKNSPVLRARNPRHKRGKLIYRDITRIEGTKGPDSQYAGQKFFHNFKRPYPEMIGLPDGSLLIRSKR